MATGRRTNKVHGLINFPVEDKKYTSSKEGGLAVYLVVDCHAELVCCQELVIQSVVDSSHWVTEIHPKKRRLRRREGSKALGFIDSLLYLGSTGWSGIDKHLNSWVCTEKDLTEEGKQLVNAIRQTLKSRNSRMYLITVLDT